MFPYKVTTSEYNFVKQTIGSFWINMKSIQLFVGK